MAIAFEFDFRSTPASGAPETGARAASCKEQGEEFAAILLRAREAETGEEAPAPQLIGPAAFTAPLLPEAEMSEGAGILAGTAAPQASEAVPGELELDREINAALEAEVLIGRPPDIGAAPAARLNAAVQAEPPMVDTESALPAAEEPAAPDAAKAAAPDAQPAAQTVAATPTDIIEALAVPASAASVFVRGEADDIGADTGLPQDKPAAPVPASAGAQTAPAQAAPDRLPDEDIRMERAVTGIAALGDKPAQADMAPPAPSVSAPIAVAAPAPPPAALQTPILTALTPAHAVVVASPVEIVDIVSKSAQDGQSDRVVVQLDPPELGRVSIDFKFDAQGLQHVTITSETPEAMRQLRAMHFELIQALERQGLDGQNLTFQHQQQSSQQAANAALLRQLQSGPAAAALAGTAAAPAIPPSGPITADGRLDIRL